MSTVSLRSLDKGDRITLIFGVVLLIGGFGVGSWFSVLVALGLLGRAGWKLFSTSRPSAARAPNIDQPWPWPPDFRAHAEALARPIDPTPRRVLPPDDKSAVIAKVATTPESLSRLIADKPPAWPWAVFTSVVLQRRNAVSTRLRNIASGYQPRRNETPMSGWAYAHLAYRSMTAIGDLVAQLEQFMLSPAFRGTFGSEEALADPDGIVAVAHRLMDYHDSFVVQSEMCLQTAVEPEVLVFVQDMGAFTLCPLVGYQRFITTMCTRIGEAQDLLPYTRGGDVVALDEVQLAMELPDGLTEQVVAHVNKFNP